LKFFESDIKGAFVVELEKIEDHRGYFARTYCKNEFQEFGLVSNWVQMNQTLTKQKGTLRGLHYQREPKTESKLIRCISGGVLDVIVDIRSESETYGQHFSTKLTSDNQRMLYVPDGVAHGFQTIMNNTELLYLHSEFYSPDHEGGILYSDPDLNILWPLPVSNISSRDQNHPKLKDIKPIDV